jgi:TetR/AcrR family transcriptional repressor of mexJK operon
MTGPSDTQPTGALALPGRPPIVEGRSTRKRRAIIEAATTLFLRHGYLGTSVDQIVALAAVSKPTVYRFFADKEQLLTEIVLGSLDRRGDPFRTELAALTQTNDLSPDLRSVARDYIKIVTQPSGLALRRLVIGASHQLPELAEAYYQRAQEQTLRSLADVFEQLAARGLLEIDEPMTAASHFAFLVLGRVLDKSLFSAEKPFTGTELERQADAGVTAFLAAYGNSTPRGSARAIV